MMKRAFCLLMAFCCAILLSGCSGNTVEENQTPVPTLAPAEARYTAPDGDGIIAKEKDFRIFLPDRDWQYLVSRDIRLEAANLNDTVEMLVKALLEYEGDTETRKLGGNWKLGLYGDHPIEISGGVCTVNLTNTARNLDLKMYYKSCLALSETLCELKEINGVNVLVEDQSVAMDIDGYLPMGTLIARPEGNIQALWEQLEGKKTPLGGKQSKNPLNALTTLYYPLQDGRGVGCTIRTVSFEGQTPEQLTAGLIDAVGMEAGKDFPDLKSLMLHEPVITVLENGRRILTLSLRDDTEDILKEAGRTDMACFVAAMTCTLTTFIPDIYQVRILIGDKPYTELKSTRFDKVTALGGLVKRSAVEQYLMSSVIVYFARNGILCECEQPVSRRSVDSLRAQLCALMEGPDPAEQAEGISATLPDTVREDDILGVSAEGDTLLVNLSESFRAEIQAQGPEAEILICYSMVNTLCKNTGMNRVRFFFEGEQEEYVAGLIYWAGEFMYNIGLAEKGLG